MDFGQRFGSSDFRDIRELLPEPVGWQKTLVDLLGVNIFLTVRSVRIYGVGNSFSSGVDEDGRYAPNATYVSGLFDKDAALLADLPHLDTLMLEANPIGDEGVRHIRLLRKLKHLNLSNTQITDGVAAVIAELPNLETIDVSRTVVSVNFAKMLRKKKKLTNLNLQNTRASNQDVSELKRSLPDCEFRID